MPDPVMTREDIYRQPATAAERGVIHKPLSAWERVYNLTAVRKVAILLVLAATWEIYARWLNNPLLNRRMNPPAAERLREIHSRTLVIGGERDVSDIQRIVAKMASEIPGAEKQIVLGAGHLVPMEKPDEFNRLVTEFLAKVYNE